jgi:ribosomal protein L37AE/L43A
MAILAKCSKCRRSYLVLGQHFRTMTKVWICPRCKRGRNLPR